MNGKRGKNNAYFLGLEKINSCKKVIDYLVDTQVQYYNKDVLEYEKRYYQNL